MKKSIVVGIILLFLLSSLIPMTSSYETNKVYSIHIDENGTLSGYVKDTSMNPIEGAKVRVYFHETYEEDYSDSSGYYHVINIPICNCTKNATASKEGYRSECVLLSIDETTIHNFVLTPLGNTLYVGGSGPGNYSRIQDAVDNASNWDTVFVYSGIYDDYSPDNYACVKITKSINLVGEDKYTTIIDRNGLHDAIKVKANDVIVKGFTIQNAGTPESTKHGAGLRLYNYNNIGVEDNNIINCYRGMWVTSGEGEIFIQNNNFSKNDWSIEISKGSTSVEVYENIFSNNNIGIIKSGKTCIFEKNHFSENEIGILLRNAESTLISNNFFNDNGIGIQSEDKTKSTITQNNFINNDRHATISRYSTILETPFFFSFRNKWIKNYWDHWISLIPRPITGNWIIMLRIFPSPMTIPIARFPYFEFDWNPAQEPYDISIPEVS